MSPPPIGSTITYAFFLAGPRKGEVVGCGMGLITFRFPGQPTEGHWTEITTGLDTEGTSWIRGADPAQVAALRVARGLE